MPSRRAVLTAALAAGALGACTSDNEPIDDDQPSPDQNLALDAWAAEQLVLDLVHSLGQGRPRRRLALAGTKAVHDAHVALLARAAPTPTSAGSSAPAKPVNDSTAYLSLAIAEDRLARRLRSSAKIAESGSFARALASMAAACAQQSSVLRGLA